MHGAFSAIAERLLGVIDTASVVCGAGSVKRYGVRPSVRLPVPEWAHNCSSKPVPAAGLLLWARRAGDVDLLLQQRRAAGHAGSAMSSAYVGR